MKTITRPRRKTNTSKQSATKFAEVFGPAPEQKLNVGGSHRHMAETRTADRKSNLGSKSERAGGGNKVAHK